jgi:hypothetical protein
MAYDDLSSWETIEHAALDHRLDVDRELDVELTCCAHQPATFGVDGVHLVLIRPLLLVLRS